MKNKHIFLAAVMAIAVSVVMTACQKNTSAESNAAGKEQLSLYLTDGPGFFDNVYIDIRSVKVLVDTSKDTRRHDNDDWDRRGADDQKKDSSFVWENLNIAPGVYDILKFRNGADTLLAASNITKGDIRLIKIEIGTRNSVVKDSITYPVYLPTNALNYILIKLRGNECENFVPGKKRLWLDFDVARSIIQGNDNRFYLRPVFHFFVVNTTGHISGRVGPSAAYPVITVFNATDTAYALPNKEGYFKLRGLKDGTYSVYFNGSNGYMDTTINNVVVKAPGETSVGVITLRK
ncbi:MAG: DUF4382 domain-containing protein [Bacteroidota bacterium]